jgi:hypothetical protein
VKTYEDVVCAILENKLDPIAREYRVKYQLRYSPVDDTVTCVIENCESAGNFANHVQSMIIDKKLHRNVRFEFPIKLY